MQYPKNIRGRAGYEPGGFQASHYALVFRTIRQEHTRRFTLSVLHFIDIHLPINHGLCYFFSFALSAFAGISWIWDIQAMTLGFFFCYFSFPLGFGVRDDNNARRGAQNVGNPLPQTGNKHTRLRADEQLKRDDRHTTGWRDLFFSLRCRMFTT